MRSEHGDEAQQGGWLAGTFAAFAVPSFRVLWLGTLLSSVAFFMSTLVNSVVAFNLTGNNRSVGTVVFAMGLAMMLLGPLGGALADRWPKRLAVGLCQSFAGLVFLSLGVLVATGAIRLALLAAGSLLIGVTFSLLGPARQALVIDLVPLERRGNAMAVSQIALSASQLLGPGVAGLLLASAFFGAAGAYLTMGGLYLVAAALLLLLPPSRVRADARARAVWSDLADGLRYVHGQRRLRLLAGFFFSVVMMGFPYVTVLPGFVENQLGREAESISLLYLISASGGLTASLVTARFADTRHAQRIFSGLALCFGVALVGLSRAPSYPVAALLMLGVGTGIGGFQAMNGAVLAHETEPVYFGRVFSLVILSFAGFGLMGLPVGLLADAVGERGALLGLGLAVIALVVGFSLALARVPPRAALGE